MSQWRPIETAPRDGRVIFVWLPTRGNIKGEFSSGFHKAQWLIGLNEWRVDGKGGNVPFFPTHWMPLPLPPEGEDS